MRCWTRRPAGQADPYGGARATEPVLTDEPCYWWVSRGREQVDDTRAVTITDEQLFLDRNADVAPGDQLVRVVDQHGRTLFDADETSGEVRLIEHVGTHLTHLDCALDAAS